MNSSVTAELLFSATSVSVRERAHGTAVYAQQHCNRTTLQLTSLRAVLLARLVQSELSVE
jgi:hypothetical protein